jgi:hypothetical protein
MVRERLREGARRRAARDLAVAEEWATLEEEAWRRRLIRCLGRLRPETMVRVDRAVALSLGLIAV